MKKIKILFILTTLSLLYSCKKDLNLVPDNIATIDNAFTNSTQAEKFLFTCYSFLPQEGHPDTNPAFNSGDEFWIYWPITSGDFFFLDTYDIARGLQNKVNPSVDYWDGFDGRTLWQGIRDCNIFLENVDKVPDLGPFLKNRWIAEAKFLKAYFHWYLFRMYGPIPIVDKNLSVSATTDEVKISQQPVDSVVNYIANLLDSAAGDGNNGLPNKITNITTEMGRITRPAVLAIKARLLVTAASPLFNGNSDYSGLINKEGKSLFNTSFDASKWERASTACKEAIDACAAAGISLYQFNSGLQNVSPATQIEMNVRNAVCEKWNNGLIWGSTIKYNSTYWLQLYACPQLDPNNINLALRGQLAPTFKIAELFYTKNGVPISEDKTWDYPDRFKLKTITTNDSLMQNGYQTVGLHFDREPRFYADMAFDGAKWFMHNQTWDVQSKAGQLSGVKQSRLYSVTGYFCKKLVNWNLVINNDNSVSVEDYPWPVFRLADLYLLYAEALNEAGKSNEAIAWLDKVRQRVGLNGVKDSWNNYSRNPEEYSTKEGLRAIIHQERLIEMAFEGSRFWDLKRWKESAQALNVPIFGWDISKSTANEYYNKVLLFNQTFISPRDYLWPIAENDLIVNSNLVQNPGW